MVQAIAGEDDRVFGNPMIAKSKPSLVVKGDMTVMDLEYGNGGEVVAAEIRVGFGVQPPVNEAL